MRKIIKNGSILTAEAEYIADIVIEDEKILEIGQHLNDSADEIIDASGKYVFPGGVDEHTHFGSFSGRTFETTDAAAVGGTTTIVDFAPQAKGESLIHAIEKHAQLAQGSACVDYAFHAMIMDPNEGVFDEIKDLPDHGISSLKMFMAYKGTPYYSNDESILHAMSKTKAAGITMMVHAENADMISFLTEKLLTEGKSDPIYHFDARPPICETEATKRAIQLAAVADTPLFVVHVTTKEAMEAIRDAYIKGQSVYGETCTHYLTLDTSYLGKPNFEGAKFICSPPLRSLQDQASLWQAVSRGWLNAVGSDHCAVMGGFESKKKGLHDFSKIPNGAPGVQDRLVMLWSQGVMKQKITKQQFVALFATQPAKNIGLSHKGQIAPGFDADIIIFDPAYRGTITQKESLAGIDYTTFEGFEMIGRPEKVFLRGNLIAENGKFMTAKGRGKRVFAHPFASSFERFKKD